MRWFVCVILLLGMLGCSPASMPPPTITPVAASGQVTLLVPQPGTTYYGEVLHISGTASEVPPQGFVLRLLRNDRLITTLPVVPQANAWAVRVPLETDQPAMLRIRAESHDGLMLYSEVTAVLGVLAERPEGTYGVIFSPDGSTVVGGEQLQVSGVVSGHVNSPLRLTATDELGQRIADVNFLLPTLTMLDEIPFTLDIPTNGTTGPLRLQLFMGDEVLDEVTVMVSDIAG